MIASCLPYVERLVAVVAHPDDETFGLGAILSDFAVAGTAVDVVCFSHGEASTLTVTEADLAVLREKEFRNAAAVLGIAGVAILDYPDGALGEVPLSELASHIDDLAGGAELVVVFDEHGVTGHPDHRRATEAAITWAESHDVPVLAWAVPLDVAEKLNHEFGASFTGQRRDNIDFDVRVDRTRQLAAVDCHQSQSKGNHVLWRRLELQAGRELLRYLTAKNLGTTETG